MKFLVVGAGALGGYFGGRLLEAGRDLTFLVRPRRAQQLAARGLVIHSPAGELRWAAPPVVLAGQIERHYDVVILGCKAYDLDAALASIDAAVGPDTVVLPLLNGLRHIDRLSERYGRRRVLGGLCQISATLDGEGAVRHLNDTHTLVFGELDGGRSARVDAIASAFAEARFDGQASDDIVQAMWEKWILIASLAGITCLLRGSVGDIVSAGAEGLALELFDECSRIAAHNAYPPSPQAIAQGRAVLTAAGSPITASMFKDLERGGPTEAEHILGDLWRRAAWAPSDAVLLRSACAHLKVHAAHFGLQRPSHLRATPPE